MNLTPDTTHVKIRTATNPNKWYRVMGMKMSFASSPRPVSVQLWGGGQVPARLVTQAK